MPDLPRPIPVQLNPPGPWIVPAADAFLGLAIDPLTAQAQLRFVLLGRVELHIPLTNIAYQSLKDILVKAPDAPDANE